MNKDVFREKFIARWDEWLAKELLLAMHAHHNVDWLVRATKAIPEKCKRMLSECANSAYDAAEEELRIHSNGQQKQETRKA